MTATAPSSLHAAARLLDRQPDVVHRDLRGELEPLRIGPCSSRAPSCCRRAPAPPRSRARDRRGTGSAARACRTSRRRRCPRCPSRSGSRPDRSRARARPGNAGGARGSGAAARGWTRWRPSPCAWAGIASPCTSMPMIVSALPLSSALSLSCLLLPAEEPRRVRPMRPVEVAGPEIVRLHHVQVAVEDQIAFACHIAPPPVSGRASQRSPSISGSAGDIKASSVTRPRCRPSRGAAWRSGWPRRYGCPRRERRAAWRSTRRRPPASAP